jgi:hypothetical protein
MARGFARGRNTPVTTSGMDAGVMEAIRPKIERSFESSRLEDEFLAIAYEMAVPFPCWGRSRVPLEGLESLASVLPALCGRPAQRAR